MDQLEMLKILAIIVLSAKFCGLIAKKLKAPEVVGMIIAGVIIGPSILGWVTTNTFLNQISELGVILLMFSAGLETNMKDLIKTGPVASLIALSGVIVPLLGGIILTIDFFGPCKIGSPEFVKAAFFGCIMAATSVSITVGALKELGKIKGKIGTTIVSAAIIDDILGIIVLTIVLGLKNPNMNPISTLISTVLFFVFSLAIGFISYKFFKFYSKKHAHSRRLAIFGLVLCFILSYIAEKYFGIADITGAYVAGVILCNIKDSTYIEEKMDIASYLLFGPVFFASIGLKTDISSFDSSLLLFTVAFVIVGLLSKIIGCGIMAKLCRFSTRESLKIGIGMMTRGEVALIVAQRGLAYNILPAKYFTAVIMLIIASSVLVPIILKLLYCKPDPHATEDENAANSPSEKHEKASTWMNI